MERTKNNSAPSEASQDSESSSNDFVKFDDHELANLPTSDFLSQFGNRVATEAMDSALEGHVSFFKQTNLIFVFRNFLAIKCS